jgi:hypothetical protein
MSSDQENSNFSTFDFSYDDPIVPRKRPIEPSGSSSEERDEARYRRGTIEYKKARKRRQNRESAIRSRGRKKYQEGSMEDEIRNLRAKNAML